MLITPIQTKVITAQQDTIIEIVDKYMPKLADKSVVLISSKIVSLCEGNVADPNTTTKDDLIKERAEYYLDRSASKYGSMFTITKNTLIPGCGIDKSNGNGQFVLWPKDPPKTASEIHQFLLTKNNINSLGVIITDSVSKPMRLGTVGLSLAHKGFEELNSYIGKDDLFGDEMQVSRANIAEGLANSAVLVMGEGAEQTPLVIINDAPFVQFNNNAEGSCYNNPPNTYKDDLYAPFLNNVNWQKGQNI